MSWHFFFMMDFIDPDTGRTPCPDYDKVFFELICLSEPLGGSCLTHRPNHVNEVNLILFFMA
jgi:hypothetical protein